MLIISHQEKILEIADEIILLANGTVKSYGSEDTMIRRVLMSEGTDVKSSCCREEKIFHE